MKSINYFSITDGTKKIVIGKKEFKNTSSGNFIQIFYLPVKIRATSLWSVVRPSFI